MKKFRFQLEPVLRKRKLFYDQCGQKLATVAQKLKTETDRLEEIKRRRSETISSLRNMTRHGITARDYAIYRPYLDRLEIEEKEQLYVIERVKVEMEKAREVLAKARIEHEIMVKMKEKSRERYQHEFNLEENKFLDEIGR